MTYHTGEKIEAVFRALVIASTLTGIFYVIGLIQGRPQAVQYSPPSAVLTNVSQI